MSDNSKIEERRQRAREAFADALESGERFTVANEDAIEAATRVKITDEAIVAYGVAWIGAVANKSGDRRRAGLHAALVELGFEVES